MPEQIKGNIELLETGLQDLYHTQYHLRNIRVKLRELKQGSSLEENINDLHNFACHLRLPKKQKINYFIFGLKQALLISQSQTYDDAAVTFPKRKHHFTDSKSETELIELLQDIRKEISLNTGIKQEPYPAPEQDKQNVQFQQSSSKLQTDMQFLKE